MKLIKNNSERAFTLLEILIAMTVIGTVVAIGAGALVQVINTYNHAELNWKMRSDLQFLSQIIQRQLLFAFSLELGPTSLDQTTDLDYYIYVDKGKVVYRHAGNDRVLLNRKELKYNLAFSRAVDDNEQLLDNAVSYTITVADSRGSKYNYSVASTVVLSNFRKQDKIQGDAVNSGKTSVYFTMNPERGGVPAAQLRSFCFVATAAYQSPLAPAVVTLSIFRDQYLLTNHLGRELVKLYYRYSPPMAERIAGNRILKYIAIILLIPFIMTAFLVIVHNLSITVILSLLLSNYCIFYLVKHNQASTVKEGVNCFVFQEQYIDNC